MSILHETVRFHREICIDFVLWGVTKVSVIRSREVSAIRRSQCTVNYRESFGTARSCSHCGGFRIRESPLSEVLLYISGQPA